MKENLSLLDTSFETGLSGTSRLHDLFISIEGMSPGEYKSGGRELAINYSFAETAFGDIIIASTAKGICHLAFVNDQKQGLLTLRENFPQASLTQKTDLLQQDALRVFTGDWTDLNKVKLHLKGTAFQLKVWQTLLTVPLGQVTSYSRIANIIQQPNASRAVGTAIGNNPVAFLIPCHRVIKETGIIGNYHWGSSRKTAMLGWEAAKISPAD